MRYSTKAWIGLAAYIATAEKFAPKDELMSDAFDRWLKTPGKFLCWAAVLLTGGHLLNLLDPRIDPWHQAGVWLTRLTTPTGK